MEEDFFKDQSTNTASDPLKEAAQDALSRVNMLSEQLVKTKKLMRLLNELVDYRGRSWPLHIKALCEKENEFLKTLRESGHAVIPVIENLYREMEPKGSGTIHSLPSDLESLAKNEGLALDFSRSRHPKYYFEDGGFIEVEVQDKKLEAKIRTRESSLAKIPADAAAIIEIVKREKKRLFDRSFAGAKLLGNLRSAYMAAIKTKNAADGDPVPLREVLEVMRRKIKARKAYKSDEFLVDLSRLVLEGPAETKGYCFELQQTKDTREGMLLLGEAGRGMVNLLIFKKSNQSEL